MMGHLDIISIMVNVQPNHYFLPTSRGGRYLCMDGHMYRLNKRKAGEWISWRCKVVDCSSTVSTIADVVTKAPTVGEQMFPLVFFLLPNKTTETYTRAFQLLKDTATNMGFRLMPHTIQMDFEMAPKSAALSVFPGAIWKGCFFHFTQCVWRKTQKAGLQTVYKVDPEVTRLIRRCAVLPLVPVANVEDVWFETLDAMPNDPRCLQVTDYITNYWIDLGDHSSWNHHDTDGPRTNNHLEGWHGRIKRIISKPHPNIFEMAKFLMEEQKLNEIRMVQYAAGQRLPPKRPKYRNVDSRLETLKHRLVNGTTSLMEYADAAAYLLKLK